MWETTVAKMGYRCQVGNARKIKFWEDVWVGTSNLAIQYWGLYVSIDEQSAPIEELWDGGNLKWTLRRCVSQKIVNQWDKVLKIASTIRFNEEDELI